MSRSVLEYLSLPKSCCIERKLYKKQFIENFSLNIHERKVLSEYVQSITLDYLLNQNTINIPPFSNDEIDYTEVAFVSVEITSQDKLKTLSKIIQYIPYPLIVIFTCKEFCCINLSNKRINKSDSTKLFVEEEYFTPWLNLESLTAIEKEFLESLHVKEHPFTDLYAFYKSYLDKLLALNASKFSGNLHVKETTEALLKEIQALHVKINELKSKLKKETVFNAKVALNIEIKKMNDKIEELKGNL